MTVAVESLFISERTCQRLPQGNADIFDRMVRIDVQIPLGFDLEIELAVTGHLLKHVVEKGNTARETALAAPVKIETDSHLGFEGVSADIGLPHVNPVKIDSC